MAGGWAPTPCNIVRELSRRSVASAPGRARAPQHGAQQQPQRRRGRSEPRSTHRRATRRLRLSRSSVASCQPPSLPPTTSTDSHTRLDTPIAAACSSPLSVGAEGLACPRVATRTASRGASSPSGVRELDRPQRNFSACGGWPGAKSRRGERRGGARRRALAHWLAWHPRPRDNNKTPAPGPKPRRKWS